MFISYGHLTQTDVVVANGVALIPLAAMETHGPHLPLATDRLIVDGIINRAAELDSTELPVYRLPTLWLGASSEHADRAGTLSVEPESLVAQIVSIGKGLARRGMHRVMLFNAHGGNIAACAIAVLKLRAKFDMLAASAHWLDFGLPDTLTPPAPAEKDVHGGWVETSMLLHLAAELVKKDLASANPPTQPVASLFPKGPVNWGWKIDDLAPGGWIGRPDMADATLGAAMTDHAARRLGETLADLVRAQWPTNR